MTNDLSAARPAPVPRVIRPGVAPITSTGRAAIGLVLCGAFMAQLLAGCGGGAIQEANAETQSSDTSTAHSEAGGSDRRRALDAASVSDGASTDATAAVAADTLVVRAKGSLLDGVGPSMQVRVNGSVVATTEVRASVYTDYSFKVGAIAADGKIDIVFTNDVYHKPQDRNLFVESITVNGKTVSASATGVVYDKGAGSKAFDGKDVVAGTSRMLSNGALRFTAPAPVAPPPPVAVVAVTSFAPKSGAPGTPVVIMGTGFGSATSVSFNGVPSLALSAASSTSVTAVVPAGATTGLVAVRSGSTTAKSTASFSVTVPVATSYAACLATAGARKVTDFGTFVPGIQDAAVRASNTASLNEALDVVGRQTGGGTVCMPPGSFYLTNRPGQKEAVVITHSATTLWGAGMDSSSGGTRLATRSDWNLSGGAVFRGNGLRIVGTSSAATAVTNIVLRDFEIDGGAGYTGNFDWPANPSSGDGWDISHKGIILAWDDCVGTVNMQRVWAHSYRGEVLYEGGQCLQKVIADGIRSEDTNASTFNITSDLTVTNSYFGKSSIWMEVGAAGPYNTSHWSNNTFADAARYGVNIAQGDGRGNTPHVFENNTFQRCGNTGFYLGGGAGGPIKITNNAFIGCSGLTTDYAVNPAPWGVSENRLVTFSNNTLTNVQTLAYLGATLIDSTISNNHVINTTGIPGATTATFLCNSNFTNVVINANTFSGTRTPEQTCSVTKGTRPTFKDNVYLSAEFRDAQGTTHITTSNASIRPELEKALVVTDVANAVAHLETALYPDGQVITLSGGSALKPLRFPSGQASYRVAAERQLSGSSLKFVYSAAEKKWVESD